MLHYFMEFLDLLINYFIDNYPNFRKIPYTWGEHILGALLTIDDDHPSMQRLRYAEFVILLYKIIKFVISIFFLILIRSELYTIKFVEFVTEDPKIVKKVVIIYDFFYTYYNYNDHRIIYIVWKLLYYILLTRYWFAVDPIYIICDLSLDTYSVIRNAELG